MTQSTTLDGLPKRFVSAMRTLFDILDDQKTGYVSFSDIQQWWQDDGAKGLPKGVLESLQKVTPPNGLLSFERFCAGLKICLLRNQVESQKTTEDPPKVQMKRPPSAPDLDNFNTNNNNNNAETMSKTNWTNTATVRPNNALASQRTASMPQLLPNTDTYGVSKGELRPFAGPIHVQNPPNHPHLGLLGPPKPPRMAILGNVDKFTERPQLGERLDRVEIRNALHNWQKGLLQSESEQNALWRGRGLADGKAATFGEPGAMQNYKKPMQKRREPRRHTLQNGIDYNVVKRLKCYEQEKEMLLRGLEAVEKTRNWYLKQVAIVQEKMKCLERPSSIMEPWTEAHAEKLELQKARIGEVNRHLAALIESWERGGLPLHMNLAVQGTSPYFLSSSSPDLIRVRQQNRLLTKELGDKTERITILEKERVSLLNDLYQAHSILQTRQKQNPSQSDKGTFM